MDKKSNARLSRLGGAKRLTRGSVGQFAEIALGRQPTA